MLPWNLPFHSKCPCKQHLSTLPHWTAFLGSELRTELTGGESCHYPGAEIGGSIAKWISCSNVCLTAFTHGVSRKLLMVGLLALTS